MGFCKSPGRCTFFFFSYLQKAIHWYWHSNNLALLRKYFNHFKRVERFLFFWWPADIHNHVFSRLNWRKAISHATIITLNIFRFWKKSMTNGTIPTFYRLAHKQYMSFFFKAHYWRKSVLMCMFRQTRAKCSNGFGETSGMCVKRNWILNNKKNDNLPRFWKCLDIWNISCYSNDIYLKMYQWLIWICPEDNGLTFDKSAEIITLTHWRVRTLSKWFSFEQPLDMRDKIELNYWS